MREALLRLDALYRKDQDFGDPPIGRPPWLQAALSSDAGKRTLALIAAGKALAEAVRLPEFTDRTLNMCGVKGDERIVHMGTDHKPDSPCALCAAIAVFERAEKEATK